MVILAISSMSVCLMCPLMSLVVTMRIIVTMLTAVSYALSFIQIPLPLSPSFAKFDLADLPALIIKYLVEEIHTTIVATVDDDGLPETAAIDMMDYDDNSIYFLTAKGKASITD